MSDPPVSGSRDKQLSQQRMRGLPSIEQARRATRGRPQSLPAKYWAWFAVLTGVAFIIWWKVEEGHIHQTRNELMARQRAVVAELGPKWFPLREKIEKWTQACGAPKLGPELVESEILAGWDFRKMPGIYLRLGLEAATGGEKLREAANKSLHDGFTACLVTAPNADPLAGPECRTAQNCPIGQHCNELGHCAPYSQPYNLRLAYRTMQVMSDEWIADLQASKRELSLRGAVATFDVATKYDLPVAIELLTRAKYYLVVVDEPATTKPAASDVAKAPDGGVLFDDRSIPTEPHKARVCAWRLADDKLVLRHRGDAAGALYGVTPQRLKSRIARQRQANSCALALSVREVLGHKPTKPSP